MKKFGAFLLSISTCFVILLFLEELITAGDAHKFEQYNTMGWIIQSLLCVSTFIASLFLADYLIKENRHYFN